MKNNRLALKDIRYTLHVKRTLFRRAGRRDILNNNNDKALFEKDMLQRILQSVTELFRFAVQERVSYR